MLRCSVRIPKAVGSQWRRRQNCARVTEHGRKECVAGVCVCFRPSVNTCTHYERTVNSLIVAPEDDLVGCQTLITEPQKQKEKKPGVDFQQLQTKLYILQAIFPFDQSTFNLTKFKEVRVKPQPQTGVEDRNVG